MVTNFTITTGEKPEFEALLLRNGGEERMIDGGPTLIKDGGSVAETYDGKHYWTLITVEIGEPDEFNFFASVNNSNRQRTATVFLTHKGIGEWEVNFDVPGKLGWGPALFEWTPNGYVTPYHPWNEDEHFESLRQKAADEVWKRIIDEWEKILVAPVVTLQPPTTAPIDDNGGNGEGQPTLSEGVGRQAKSKQTSNSESYREIRSGTWESFRDWMLDHTARWQGQEIQSDDGKYILDRVRYEGGVTRLTMTGILISELNLRSRTQITLMQFDVWNLANGRFEVQNWCASKPPLVVELFNELQADIERRWPAESEAGTEHKRTKQMANGKINEQKRGMNAETPSKLQKLLQVKRDSIRNGKVGVSFSKACQLAGVDADTVKRNAPEIQEQWNDPGHLPSFN